MTVSLWGISFTCNVLRVVHCVHGSAGNPHQIHEVGWLEAPTKRDRLFVIAPRPMESRVVKNVVTPGVFTMFPVFVLFFLSFAPNSLQRWA